MHTSNITEIEQVTFRNMYKCPPPLPPHTNPTHMHVAILKKTKGQEFEREQDGLFGNLWVKEMK